MSLSAGVAREIISPDIGTVLFGYLQCPVSHSIHDDLTVTALALESNGTALLLLSATVCLFNNSLADEIRMQVGIAAGIPAEQVILSATHTHSGPYTDEHIALGSIDRDYCDRILIPKCIAAGRNAMNTRQPVKMGIGTTESLVGVNRRQMLRDGSIILGQNPWGIYDPIMTVITFAGKDDKPLANLVHIGAHSTAAGISHEITRDWPGIMIDRLDEESGAITLFFNGTAGDVAPRIANGGSTGNMRYSMEIGSLAGIDAVRAFKSIRTYRDEPLAFTLGDIKLPFKAPYPVEKIPERLKVIGNKWCWERFSLEQLAALYETGEMGPEALHYRQTIIRIGPVALVPFPFEICSEIGLRLRDYSPFAHTLLLSCTNGSNSYLVTQNQICQGGYEVEEFYWFRPCQLPDNADAMLIEKNLRLLDKVYYFC